MKALQAVLLCLIVCTILTNATAAALRPLIQHDDSPMLNERAASRGASKASRKGPPRLITLGDPIEDPTPHKH